jgi:hypothetical protein
MYVGAERIMQLQVMYKHQLELHKAMTPCSEKDLLEERFPFGMLTFRVDILDLQEQGVR